MTTRRSAVTVVGALACLLAATTFVGTSKAAAVAAPVPLAPSLFDVHTPLPVEPCNGAAFAHGTTITFVWRPINQRYYYMWRQGTSAVQTLDTTLNRLASSPGNGYWTVESVGVWGTSEKSQRCDFTILAPM